MARELIGRVRQALGDRYNVITAVGRGGNATLYGAFDRDGRRVAIKVLHPELAVSVAADRFLREIRYASTLDHPHIAPLPRSSTRWDTPTRRVSRIAISSRTTSCCRPREAARSWSILGSRGRSPTPARTV